MHIKAASHIVFALTMLAIGVLGLLSHDFAPIWQPVPSGFPDRQLIAALCTFVSLSCGVGLLIKRTSAPAALLLLAYLLIWTIVFKIPFIIGAPLVEGAYQSWGENTVLIAGAWAFYASLVEGRKSLGSSLLGGAAGLRTSRVLYGLALIAFGLSHFVYLDLTAPLVPAWLPAPVFWAYSTGIIYLVTGVALVTGILARLGAAAAAFQIALITLLVWGPMVLSRQMSPMHSQEAVVSWALTASAWVVATSFDDRGWFQRRGGTQGQQKASEPLTG
jgi:uncharacterized membrane protein